MYCMNCGAELPKDATFCSWCGEMCLKPLVRTSAPKRNAAAAPITQKRSIPQKSGFSWGIGSILAGTAIGLFFSRLFGGSHSAPHVSHTDASSHVHDTFVYGHDDHDYGDYHDHNYDDHLDTDWDDSGHDDDFDDDYGEDYGSDYDNDVDNFDDFDSDYGDEYDD
ncbi:MAG: zinc ribbon domain-containing protein [Schwartzia sp.]|nr:zinc ribbon domain-containing protein [Schwartzia sp. (in: firmicutes)]